jgi:hypothetical protein
VLAKSAVVENHSVEGAGIGSSGTATLINSTVSSNTGEDSLASAIELWSGNATLINSTLVWGSNTQSLISFNGAELIVTNSLIVSASGKPACLFLGGDTVISGGGNVQSPGDDCRLTDPTDQVAVTDVNLKLGPLADNGGPTKTHALLPSSVAIDWISQSMCVDANGDPLTTDQRGEPRPVAILGPEPRCDVGAFEVQP